MGLYTNLAKSTAVKASGEDLTLSKMEELYKKAMTLGGCEVCGRAVRHIYFLERKPFYACCGYHQLKEVKK